MAQPMLGKAARIGAPSSHFENPAKSLVLRIKKRFCLRYLISHFSVFVLCDPHLLSSSVFCEAALGFCYGCCSIGFC